MNRAVFFDVDGVIRHNNTSKEDGCYYCLSYDQVDYINGIVQAHSYLQEAGYRIFWVTMQNCIKEGFVEEDDVHDILMRMCKFFDDNGIHVEDYQICQSKEESDESKALYKKYAVEKLAMVYNIDLSRSIGIGDRRHDIEAYNMAGIGTTIQALNLYGDKKCEADYHYSNNLHIANLDTLFNVLMIHHGCNDIPRILNIAKHFPRVEKVWGEEYHIVNDEHGNYCSKFLVLKQDHISSLHYHGEKHETFTVLAGVVRVEQNNIVHTLIKGDSVFIHTGDYHRFSSICGDAILLETSTFHKDEDTFRLEDSK